MRAVDGYEEVLVESIIAQCVLDLREPEIELAVMVHFEPAELARRGNIDGVGASFEVAQLVWDLCHDAPVAVSAVVFCGEACGIKSWDVRVALYRMIGGAVSAWRKVS